MTRFARIQTPEPAPAWAADLVAGLAALRAEVGALRDDLRRGRRPDDEELGALLSAVAAAVEDRAFSSAEVIAHARLPAASALADALRSCGATSPRRLGKLLRRCETRPTGGVVIERIGVDRGGAIWRARVCGLHGANPR